MTATALRVSWYRLRGTSRRRLGGYLSLIVLIALIGGVSMASIAAGRRTQSSYQAFLRSTNPSDLSVAVYGPNGQTVADITDQIRHLPGVKHVDTAVAPTIIRMEPNGAPDLTVVSSVTALASADGEFVDQDRLALVSGRRANQARPDEAVVDPTSARVLGLHVGSVVPIGLYSPSQMALPQFGTPAVAPLYRINLRVVGIVEANNQLIEDDIDKAYGAVYLTAAFVHQAAAVVPGAFIPAGYAVQLDQGRRGVPAAEAQISKVIPRNAQTQFHLVSRAVANVELALRPESVAIAGFGLIAALVALVIGIQEISRQIRSEDTDRDVLRALGAGVSVTTADGFYGTMVAIIIGAIGAVVVAFGLSPLAPLGPVRPFYPGRGPAFDWTVEGSGMGILVVVLGATALWVAFRSAFAQTGRGERARSASFNLGGAAAAAGVPIAGQVGLRLALDSGRGRTSVPVRSVMVGGVVAVTLVVATLMFASSLQTLVSHPALYGWDWSFVLDPSNNLPLATEKALDHDPDVAAWSGVDYTNLEIDGVAVPVLASKTAGDGLVAPPILSGHGVQAPNQIVIGATTLAELHKHVGGTVTLTIGSAAGGPLSFPPTVLHIVGTATFPAVGFASLISDHTSMGTGALFSEDALPAAFRAAESSRDPNLAGPNLAFIRMRTGVSRAAGQANLQALAAQADKLYAADPNAVGNAIIVLGVQRPAQIVDYRSVGAAPVVLSIGLALGAIVALGLTLRASVRRRRRDLAVLKSLGFTQRQLAGAVAWQATVSALVAVVIGIPLGLAGGRALWTQFAHTLDVVPDPTVPILSVVLVAVGAFLFSNLVAALPGRAAARVPTATLLRAE